jgi:predicted RNA-binding Zn-ribbon protein involved in translation (DUF1610 family)/chaperonin cofactor prefoldin
MAATLTAGGEMLYASFPIAKTERTPDGDLYVYGIASDGTLDSDEQIIDPDFSSKAIREWLADGANVRVQHNAQRDPAGIGVEADTDANGATWVKSLVVEPIAQRLVEKGALRAYSVGIARPKIVRDSVARGGRIVDGQIVEISLVDRPANKACGIQLVKSDDGGHATYVGKTFGATDVLIKGEDTGTITDEGTTVTKSADVVPVDLPRDVSVSFSPTDLAKLLEHRRIAEERVIAGEVVEKRKMDPDVGGGVDRDKIPSEDFAGRDRSFPIVTPGDVSDAASSLGRAGSDNYSTDKIKSNIIRIARRKGHPFVNALPESWKKDMDLSKGHDDDDAMEKGGVMTEDVAEPDMEKDMTGKKAKNGKKPAFSGAHPPFSGGHQPPHTDEDDKAIAEAQGKKGKKKAMKSIAVKGDDKEKVMCPGCGANIDAMHNFCPECGKKVPSSAMSMEKNHDYTCLGCGRQLDKGEKYCPGCGKENPGYMPMADSKVKKSDGNGDEAMGEDVEKGRNPGPGAGVVGAGAADIKAVPEHREPDGMFVEEFEKDLNLTDGDEAREIRESKDRNPAIEAAMYMKSIGVPYDLGALHDLTCAAYRPADSNKAHPTHTVTGVDTSFWQQKSLDMAASAPLDAARDMARLWQHSITLKNADPVEVEELREELYKAFKDANPGPGTFPMPGMLCAGDFKRPFLADDHARRSPGAEGPHTFSHYGTQVDAEDFRRGPITAGHAERSPSNKSMPSPIIEPAPLPTGMGRTYYRNAQRDAAMSAMGAMHDHIAQTFPDLCPMSGPGVGGVPAEGSRPVPLPVGKSEEAPKVKKDKSEVVEEAAPEIVQKAAVDPDLIKSAVLEATSALSEQIAALTKAFEVAQKKNKKLQARVDELGAQPDPRESPFKGIAQQFPVAKSATVLPAGARNTAEYAENMRMNEIRAMQAQARSHDPAEREAAWNVLMQMGGLSA